MRLAATLARALEDPSAGVWNHRSNIVLRSDAAPLQED